VPLYAGGMTWREGLETLDRFGYAIESILPGFADPATGQLLQADVVAFREGTD
jgi:hypothetical protein